MEWRINEMDACFGEIITQEGKVDEVLPQYFSVYWKYYEN